MSEDYMKKISTPQGKEIISNMDQTFKKHSEMSLSEQEFLAEIILQYKPKKVLEVGVAAGSSSVIMLEALKSISDDFDFYSVDFREQYYRDESKKSGFIVEQYPELLKKRNFFTGGYVGLFLEEIGADIDLCLIDTVHLLPGELFDFIMILPYLKKEAIVIIHDINLHTWHSSNAISNNLLFSALSGEKILPATFEEEFYHHIEEKNYKMFFENIGAIKLDACQMDRIWDVFNLLTQEWAYIPSQKNLSVFENFLAKNYDASFLEYFKSVVAYQHSIKAKI